MAKIAKESAKVRSAYKSLLEEIDKKEYELRMKRNELEEIKRKLK